MAKGFQRIQWMLGVYMKSYIIRPISELQYDFFFLCRIIFFSRFLKPSLIFQSKSYQQSRNSSRTFLNRNSSASFFLFKAETSISNFSSPKLTHSSTRTPFSTTKSVVLAPFLQEFTLFSLRNYSRIYILITTFLIYHSCEQTNIAALIDKYYYTF